LDGGDQARLEQARALGRGSHTCVKIERRPGQHHPWHVGHALHCVQSIRSKHPSRFMAWSAGQGRQHIAMVGGDRSDVLALLGFIPSVPEASPPLFAPVVVPSPWRTRPARGFSAARLTPTGHARRLERPSSGPCGQGSVAVRGVQGGCASDGLGHGHARPWPPGLEHPSAAVAEAMRAELARRTTVGPREVRDETGVECVCGSWPRDGRAVGCVGRCAHRLRASCEAC